MGREKIDISKGQKFGRLTIIEEVEPTLYDYKWYSTKMRNFLVQCECGNKKVVSMQYLRNGQTKSCGCIRTETLMGRKRKDVKEGSVYGALTVIKEVDRYQLPNGAFNRMFLVQCECGKQKVVFIHNLLHQDNKSCRCSRLRKMGREKSVNCQPTSN